MTGYEYVLTEGCRDDAERPGLVVSHTPIDPEAVESWVGSWLIAHCANRDAEEVRLSRTHVPGVVTWVANVEDELGEVTCKGFLTLTGPDAEKMV
jgi:hypothetical protein